MEALKYHLIMKTITLTKVEILQTIEAFTDDMFPKIKYETKETQFDINTEAILYYYDNYVVTARLISVPNTNLRVNEVIEVKQTREEIKKLIENE